MAKEQASGESEVRDEEELTKLKEFYGTTGSRLATGGSKAVKDLGKEQKNRANAVIKKNIDIALVEIQFQLINKSRFNLPATSTSIIVDDTYILETVEDIQKLRMKLKSNTNLILSLEALMCQFTVRRKA
jgi:DNA polymerase-3 subunit delta'